MITPLDIKIGRLHVVLKSSHEGPEALQGLISITFPIIMFSLGPVNPQGQSQIFWLISPLDIKTVWLHAVLKSSHEGPQSLQGLISVTFPIIMFMCTSPTSTARGSRPACPFSTIKHKTDIKSELNKQINSLSLFKWDTQPICSACPWCISELIHSNVKKNQQYKKDCLKNKDQKPS